MSFSSASEKIAARYAVIFVSVFDGISSAPGRPVLPRGGWPQAGANGVPFRGSNALITSLVAATGRKSRGYTVPVWLTRSKIQELGLLINRGERNTPIVHYDIYYEDVRTKKRDPAMDDGRYALLSDEERKNWVKRCYMTGYPEFNIHQTNFAEVYPEQWDALLSEFGAPARKADCPALDAVVGGGRWLCPITESTDVTRMSYIEKTDEIRVPPKADYTDESRWYGDLSYILARSTGSEGRLDRDINCPDLSALAKEELVSELAGATVATLAGAVSCIQDHNLVHLKAWVSAIKEDPRVIFKAVTEASKAAELVSSTLGLEQRKGFSLDRLMEGVESAREAREKEQQRRSERAGKARAGHRKGWSPVKSPRKGRTH